MGGLLGGLLDVFYNIGRAIFTFLIGAKRANHGSIRGAAVFVGGAVPGIVLSFILYLLTWDRWDSRGMPSSLGAITVLSIVSGGLAGGVFAVILLLVAASIEEAEEKEKHEAKRQAKERDEEEKRKRVRDVKRAKFKDDLIAQGVDPVEAEYRAEQEVRDPSGGCFIATAVFDSPDAFEVRTLREWRDGFLLSFLVGRLFVKVYYNVSPYFVLLVKNNLPVKQFIRTLLQAFVKLINQQRERD